MSLKPQDIVVLLKLCVSSPGWTYRVLSSELSISVSEIHQCLQRAAASDLYDPQRRRAKLRNLQEFILYGLKYAFPAIRGSLTRGLPTSYAAPPLAKHFHEPLADNPPVWSVAQGSVSGYEISPLYPSAPKAAKLDPRLYELLALIDALRIGKARERKLAQDMLSQRLTGKIGEQKTSQS
jgi:hypothetical protein